MMFGGAIKTVGCSTKLLLTVCVCVFKLKAIMYEFVLLPTGE